MTEIESVLFRATIILRNRHHAMIWFKHSHLLFLGCTPEQACREGCAGAVHRFLDQVGLRND